MRKIKASIFLCLVDLLLGIGNLIIGIKHNNIAFMILASVLIVLCVVEAVMLKSSHKNVKAAHSIIYNAVNEDDSKFSDN